ncbi:PREDICTED: MORN repeat-containing protein 3 [Hipposideros armiger]|uniref:MORN repeat-containing protein 3 n=1 Tax=Hipposideros armiger TaxID=186990 RepID=A0A8B7RVP8_HIPAR|nr:PREDICTED: MORN repeat-containing protein 3 [Hipposideros armiger]
MPISKCLKKSEPLWKGWDWKAQKNGPRHQVYAVNGDCYVGEWKDNMKHATLAAPGRRSARSWLQYRPEAATPLLPPRDSGSRLHPTENGNRYEGYWQRGLKNGSGRFFHLDHGQLFEGFWVDDVAKCGTMIDFGRDEAPQPTQFPIPEIKLLDPDGVLEEALAMFKKTQGD